MVYFAKWKIVMVLAICLLGVLFAAPNLVKPKVLEGLPDWLPHKQISLGLDLRGGSHLLLEVDVDAVIKERMEGLVDSVRADLRKARIRYTGLGIDGHGIKVTIRDTDKLDEARTLVRDQERDNEITVNGNTLHSAMPEKAISEARIAAVEQSIEIIRRQVASS